MKNHAPRPEKPQSARSLALVSLLALERDGRYSNLEVDARLRTAELAPADRALYTRLVYGVTERRITLDWIIDRYSTRGAAELDPDVRCALRMGIYQLLFMDRIPEHAAVDESVNLVPRAKSGYVNAVLRAFLRADKHIDWPEGSGGLSYYSVKYSIPEPLAAIYRDALDDPEELGDEAIVDKLTKLHKKGMAYDEKILNCSVRVEFQKYSKLFLSKNKDLEQNVMWSSAAVTVNTKRGNEVKDSYESFSIMGGLEILDSLDEKIESTAKVALELLDSEPIKPGVYDCVCTPEVTGMIVHEAFGHGVEMDMFVKDRALAKKYVGEYVASPLVTMHDGNAVAQTATYFFDDEGTLSHDTVVIDEGILVNGISDLQSAMALGTEPTGNGRRESYRRKAYTRMTNTYFEPGTDKVEDMIASIKDGLLLEMPFSGMEDPKNWGIQCMVNFAREIKDGKLTGKIFSPIVLTGYVPDLLKSISMMSDTKQLSGGGFCGKGYKEWVKVSDGGPYIKAKIRLG